MAVQLRVVGAWSGSVTVPSLSDWGLTELRDAIEKQSGLEMSSVKIICAGRVLKDGNDIRENDENEMIGRVEGAGRESTTHGSSLQGAREGVETMRNEDIASDWKSVEAGDKRENERDGGDVSLKRMRSDVKGKSLASLGITAASRLLLSKAAGTAERSQLRGEAEREERLQRIRAAAAAIAGRARFSNESDDKDEIDIGLASGTPEVQLEDQNGVPVKFGSESDKRALCLGLTLHSTGGRLLREGRLDEAKEVFIMAEDAFSLCPPKYLQLVDNEAMLLLDIVWTFFLQRDLTALPSATSRLSRASRLLQSAHGPNLERLRLLHGGFQPELATYLRLHLLQGVVSFHEGNKEEAKRSLLEAQALLEKLQVSDSSIAELAAMGFTLKEAQRALRMSGGSVERAAEFVLLQREKQRHRREEERRQRKMRREKKRLGKTPKGLWVDMDAMQRLEAMGFDPHLAAEALRQSENDEQQAMDSLLDPIRAESLMISLVAAREDDQAHSGSSSHRKQPFTSSELEGGVGAGASADVSLADADVEGKASMIGNDSREEGLRDGEMEEEIAHDITGNALSEYDLDVSREGEAVLEYLAMIES